MASVVSVAVSPNKIEDTTADMKTSETESSSGDSNAAGVNGSHASSSSSLAVLSREWTVWRK